MASLTDPENNTYHSLFTINIRYGNSEDKGCYNLIICFTLNSHTLVKNTDIYMYMVRFKKKMYIIKYFTNNFLKICLSGYDGKTCVACRHF